MGTPNTNLWGTMFFGGPSSSPNPAGTGIVVSNLIYEAYRIAGVLAEAGRGYSPEMLSDGFDTLNEILDSWTTEGTLIYQVTRGVYPLTSGKQEYLIGPGAPDIDGPRPPQIIAAGVLLNTTLHEERRLIVLNPIEWSLLPTKSLADPLPRTLYYDHAVPVGTLTIWPIPSVGGLQFTLYCWLPLPQFTSLSDTVYLPYGYRRGIVYQLAIELALRTPRRAKLSPDAERIAAEAKAAIQAWNALHFGLSIPSAK